MIGLQHYEIAQWTNIGPWGGGEWARGTLKVNSPVLQSARPRAVDSGEAKMRTASWENVDKHMPRKIRNNQGSLKGESVVAAILSSRMEQSYCTSGFFRFQARFLTSSAPILTITHYLRMCFTQRVILYAPPVVTSMSLRHVCKRRTFSKIKNLRFQNYDDYNYIINFGIKSKGLSLSLFEGLCSEIKMCWL